MKIWPFALSLFFLTSCVELFNETVDKASKTNSVVWSPEIAIPLVYSTLSMQDIIEVTDDLARHRIESDKTVTLIYESTLFSLKAEDALQLPNQNFSELINLTAAQANSLNTSGSVSIPLSVVVDFNLGAHELDSVWLKAGNFHVSVSSSLQHDLNTTVSIAQSRLAGSEVSHSVQANYGGSTPTTGSSTRDISGALLDLRATPQNHSQLQMDLLVNVTKNASNPVGSNEYINVSYGLKDLEFSMIKGYIANANLSNGNDSLFIKIFKNNEDGTFSLVEPRVKLNFINSFGVPLRAYLTQFSGINQQNGNSLDLTGYPSQFDFVEAPYVGGRSIDSTLLDKNNSNIVAYIDNKPYSNVYEYSIATNPSGPSQRSWLLDTSVLRCDVEMDFPLYGTASDYSLDSEVELDVGSELDNEVEEVLMRLHTENGFPIDVAMQVYLTDTVSGFILDSLFTDDLLVLRSSVIDAGGKTVEASAKTVDFLFDTDRIERLKQANRLHYVAYFNTLDDNGFQPDVRIFEGYEMLIQFGIQAKLNIHE